MGTVMELVVTVCSVATTAMLGVLTWAVLRSPQTEARHMHVESAPSPSPHPPAGDGDGRNRRQRDREGWPMPVDVP